MTKKNTLIPYLLGLLFNFIFIFAAYSFPYFMAFGSVYKTDSITGMTAVPDDPVTEQELLAYEQGNNQVTGSNKSDITNDNTSNKLSYLNEDALKSSYSTSTNTSTSTVNANRDRQSDSATESKKSSDSEKNKTKINEQSSASPNQYPDPYEDYNRAMYSVNKTIDKFAIKPLAQVYTAILPLPVKHMVTNFFSNIFEITVFLNDLLQAESSHSADTLSRFVINSSFGIFGLIDVAKDMGFPRRSNDFGVTFGKWGMTQSNYFVVPFFGPSTVRDFLGKGVGLITTYGYYYLPHQYDVPLFTLFMLDTRSNLLTAEKIIDTVSDDEYVFIRNSYLQYRDALIRGEKIDTKREEHEDNLLSDIMAEQNKADNSAIVDDELKDLDDLDNSEELRDLDDLKN